MQNERLKNFYEFAPYPPLLKLASWDHSEFQRGVLNLTLGRTEKHPEFLSSEMKIWVMGCGTIQAIETALNFPQAEIVASDLSSISLEIAATLADQLGVSNITFRNEDLLGVNYLEEFDYVVATGVIHHLPVPSEGLSVLRRALKPRGISHLFLYNRWHRLPLQRFQDLAACISPVTQPLETRRATAIELLNTLEKHSADDVWNEQLSYFKPDSIRNSSELEDCLLHPSETAYSPNETIEFLEAGGMRFHAWLQPYLWNGTTLSLPSIISEKLHSMNDLERWTSIYQFLGRQSPHLEFFAVREDAPKTKEITEAQLLNLKPLISAINLRSIGENNQVGAPRQQPAFRVIGPNLAFLKAGQDSTASGDWYGFSQKTEEIFNYCDGQHTIGQIIEQLPVSKSAVVKFFREKVLPPSTAVICSAKF